LLLTFLPGFKGERGILYQIRFTIGHLSSNAYGIERCYYGIKYVKAGPTTDLMYGGNLVTWKNLVVVNAKISDAFNKVDAATAKTWAEKKHAQVVYLPRLTTPSDKQRHERKCTPVVH
jgi:hypothetical protein